jgi:hypothetical protein
MIQKWAAIIVLSVGIALVSVAAGIICLGLCALLDAITPDMSKNTDG